jgi:hypothetical protein
MSTPRDMAETELRDAWGNPVSCPATRPIAKVSDTHAPTNTNIDQSIGKNDKLPWVGLLGVMSGGALVAVLLLAWFVPIIIDAKVRAGSAKCEAISELARSDAAVAKDTVDQWAAKQKAGVK